MYMYINIDDDGNLNYLQIGIANLVIKTLQNLRNLHF